jgi:hypothetical protein
MHRFLGRKCCPGNAVCNLLMDLLWRAQLFNILHIALPLISKTLIHTYDNCQYNSDIPQVWELTLRGSRNGSIQLAFGCRCF